MSLPLKFLDLFFRKIWRFIFPKADVKKTVQVITDQPVEAVPVEVKERCCLNSNGCNVITKTTVVTGKGQCYFINRFLGKQNGVAQ